MILSNDPRAVLAKKRTIAVRTEAIFAAFSDPAQLACWWGPEGFTNSFETFGFEPEGLCVFVMYGPNGIEHPNECEFPDVSPLKKLRSSTSSNQDYCLRLTLKHDTDRESLSLSWDH